MKKLQILLMGLISLHRSPIELYRGEFLKTLIDVACHFFYGTKYPFGCAAGHNLAYDKNF
jgi:hypothetical protein